MSNEMDLKAAKVLESTSADLENKLQDRLKEKWPEYRETENAAAQREILISHHRRMATRSARAWMPPTADQELRAVETLLMNFIDDTRRPDGVAADADGIVAHRIATQGLTNLGITLANVLQAVEGGTAAARMAAIEWVAEALARGDETVEILEASTHYEGARRPADEPIDAP